MRRDPTRARPYLADPNYYRIGYQLVAQSVNEDLVLRRGTSPPNDWDRRPPDKRHEPRVVADEIIASAELMLSWYRNRARTATKHWFRAYAVQPHERRLERFLERTVLPCTRLARAAADGDSPTEADRKAVQDVIAAADAGQVSYRVHYALACWFSRAESARPWGEESSDALKHLDIALRDAPEDSRHDLAEWSLVDPGLESLRVRMTAREFAAHVEPFRRPQLSLASNGAPLPGGVLRDLGAGLSDSFAVLPSVVGHEDEIVRTVAAFLNTRGGTLLIGAVERRDPGRWADEHMRDAEAVGDWLLVGIDEELRHGGWHAFERRLQSLLSERITPDPSAARTVLRHWVEQRTLATIVVEPAADPSFIVDDFGPSHEGGFWGRKAARNEQFTGTAIKDFWRRAHRSTSPDVGDAASGSAKD